jgi:hypothetical protein
LILSGALDEVFKVGGRIPNTPANEDVRQSPRLPFLAKRAGADGQPARGLGFGKKGGGLSHGTIAPDRNRRRNRTFAAECEA